MSSLTLPDGSLRALAWEIPHQMGGRTKAMLQRSCQMVAASGRDVVVMTLAHQVDLDDIRASLRDRGLLIDGVTILNMWEELGAADDGVWTTAPFDPSVTSPVLDTAPYDGRDTDAPAAEVEEIRRPDGSILARHHSRGGWDPIAVDRTEMWDRHGTFLGGWNGSWPLWRWWLDRVLPRPSHLIVDDAYPGHCLAAAPLTGVSTTYVVHNSHITAGRQPPYARLERWRAFTLPRAGAFDAIVYLTDTQRADADRLLGPQSNAHVVPNAFEHRSTSRRRRRLKGRGIVMANLVGRKRIPHAVRAVAIARDSARNVELTIYGQGPHREAVETAITEHDAPVRLEGYTSDPSAAFSGSSYMLLTSVREGLPLVLVESMAAGCLPITYDIPYGPADVVRDGVDGFVVPMADVDALAARVVDVATSSRRRLRRMRRDARRRAEQFTPRSLLPRWGSVLVSAASRASQRIDGAGPTVDILTELERAASTHRVTDCRLEAVLTDVGWDHHDVATVEVSCSILGTGGLFGVPHVDVELVHRPSGARAVPPKVESSRPEMSPPDPTTTLRITLDPSTVDQPADHVLLLRAQLGEIDVLDTIRLPDGAPTWLPLPRVSAARPVLLPDRRGGVRLVTATPHAAGGVEVSSEDLLVDVEALAAGAEVETVDAKSLGGEPPLTAECLADGRFLLRVPEAGRWKIRAKIDGRWRDVAWRGPEPVPTSGGPLRVELSPRGYLRLLRPPERPDAEEPTVSPS